MCCSKSHARHDIILRNSFYNRFTICYMLFYFLVKTKGRMPTNILDEGRTFKLLINWVSFSLSVIWTILCFPLILDINYIYYWKFDMYLRRFYLCQAFCYVLGISWGYYPQRSASLMRECVTSYSSHFVINLVPRCEGQDLNSVNPDYLLCKAPWKHAFQVYGYKIQVLQSQHSQSLLFSTECQHFT